MPPLVHVVKGSCKIPAAINNAHVKNIYITTCNVCQRSIQLSLPTSPTPLLPCGVCAVARQIYLSISLPVILTSSLSIAATSLQLSHSLTARCHVSDCICPLTLDNMFDKFG